MHKHAHTHTQAPTPTFVGATKNLIFSHYLCILAKAAGENLLPRTQNKTQTRTRIRKRTRTELSLSCEKPNKAGSPLLPWVRVRVFVSVCLSISLSGCHTREFNVCVIWKQCENCAYAQCCDSTDSLFPLQLTTPITAPRCLHPSITLFDKQVICIWQVDNPTAAGACAKGVKVAEGNGATGGWFKSAPCQICCQFALTTNCQKQLPAAWAAGTVAAPRSSCQSQLSQSAFLCDSLWRIEDKLRSDLFFCML